MYSGLLHRNCETTEERVATAKPIRENATTVFVTVLSIAMASPFWFFPSFSEANLVMAVGSASKVRRENAEAKKLRIDSVPMSVSLKSIGGRVTTM